MLWQHSTFMYKKNQPSALIILFIKINDIILFIIILSDFNYIT